MTAAIVFAILSVMLSIWASPVKNAEELGRLHQVHRPKEFTGAGPVV